MPKFEKYDEGTPSYVELMTPDQKASADFYGQLFGWTTEESPLEGGMVYLSGNLPDGRVSGISPQMPGMEGMPAFWGVYLTVDDVDATAAKVTEAGGTVLAEPFDVMTFGRMAAVQDPTGARFNLWQAGDSIGTEVANEAGSPVWNECVSPDPVRALQFYSDVFGMTAEEMDMGGGMGTYRVLSNSAGHQCAGLMAPPPGVEMPPHWNVYFGVDNVDDSVTKTTGLGGTAVVPAMDVPGVGRMAMVADPQGAMFWVMTGESQD